MNFKLEQALENLVSVAIEEKLNATKIKVLIGDFFRKRGTGHWVRHRKGCTHEMRNRKYTLAKEQLRSTLHEIDLTPDDVRRLTKQS